MGTFPASKEDQAHPERGARLTTVIAVHALAPLAIFFPSWLGLAAFAISTVAIGMFGISIGYHRLLTHRSFDTFRPLRRLLATLGSLALQGGPITWVATHRLHHQASDKQNDPHSPQHGFWWAHLGWIFSVHPQLATREKKMHFAPELARDPYLIWLERYHPAIYLVKMAALVVAGYAMADWELGLSLLLWGGVMRQLYIWHVTWLVNSLGHWRGERDYDTSDSSQNVWLLALLSFGEGWHNNHHARPASAAFGHRWPQLDLGYCAIRLLNRAHLVWQINDASREARATSLTRSPGKLRAQSP